LTALSAFAGAMALRPASAAGQFKMGLLVPGSVAEEGWNRIAYNALKQVEAQLGAKISYVELRQNPASFEKAFRDYAALGYDVVLGHGFEFQDSALTVAEDYPDT
jgi:basic membrane protein A